MKATFENTVSILVKAYLNDTLQHGDCAACAVGNIIAANIGAKVVPEKINCNGYWKRNHDNLTIAWNDVFMTPFRENQRFQLENYKGQIKRQIDASGYSVHDLAKIEFAFERAHNPEYNIRTDGLPDDFLNPEWMFNGLMAVLDVLAEIHNVDLSVKESAKLLFQKA